MESGIRMKSLSLLGQLFPLRFLAIQSSWLQIPSVMCNVRVFQLNWSKCQLNCVTVGNLDHPHTVRIVLIEWVAGRLEWSFQSRQMLDTGVGEGGERRGCGQRGKDHTRRGHIVCVCMGHNLSRTVRTYAQIKLHYFKWWKPVQSKVWILIWCC